MRFFVYDLIDPRSDEVFYVGKGCGNRPHQHMSEARGGKRTKKCDRIRAIESSGSRVKVRIVARYEAEQDAYQHEVERIAEIGLDALTNVLPGGRSGRMARDLSIAEKIPRSVALAIAKAIHIGQQGYRLMWGEVDLSQFASDRLDALIERLGPKVVTDRFEAVGVLLTGRNNAIR